MSKLRHTKEGLLIPSSLLKGLTGPVSVQRQGNVLLIESEGRRMARRRVARMVQSLRRAASAKWMSTMTLRSKQQKSRRKRTGRTPQSSVQKLVARQKKVLLSLAGIGASGFTDISVAHDTYLYEKP